MKKADLLFGPISIGAYRVLGGAVILVLIALCSRQWQWPTRKQITPLLIIITIGYIIPYTIQPFLVPICGSGFVGMLVGFVPLMTILVSIPLLRIRPNQQQAIGVIGGLCCLGLVLKDGFDRPFEWWYMLIGLLVPTMYAITNTTVKRNLSDVPALISSSWCLAGASIVLIPIGLYLEPIKDTEHIALPIACVSILGLVGTGLVMFAFYALIKMRGPLYAGLVAYVIPIGAVLIGGLDGESISSYQIMAMIGIIAMVVMVQRSTPASQQPD